MNAGQAPYQKAANDECRICGGTHTILSFFFCFFHEWIENSSSLADFQRVLLLILIITRTSQALVTGKRSYIESCCCVCVCVCCHCFSSGVKIKRKREREDT